MKGFVKSLVVVSISVAIFGFIVFGNSLNLLETIINENYKQFSVANDSLSPTEDVVHPIAYDISPETTIIIPQTEIIKPHFSEQRPDEFVSYPNSESSKLGLDIQSAFAIPSNAVNLFITEWSVPTVNARPWDIDNVELGVTVDTNTLFFTERDANKIGRLETSPSGDVITEWTVPDSAVFNNIKDLVTRTNIEDDQGDPPSIPEVWFVETIDEQIGRLHIPTNTISSWDVPNPEGVGDGIALDSFHKVWYTDGRNSIVRLDPTTNEFTWWTMTGIICQPKDVAIDDQDKVWYVCRNTQKVGRLDPTNNMNVQWTMPNAADIPQPEQIAFSFNSLTAWFTTQRLPFVVNLDPLTNVMTIYTMPGGSGQFGIAVTGSDDVWIVKSDRNSVIRLASFTNVITEWVLPTSACVPVGIVADDAGQIWVAELGCGAGNVEGRIAKLVN